MYEPHCEICFENVAVYNSVDFEVKKLELRYFLKYALKPSLYKQTKG